VTAALADTGLWVYMASCVDPKVGIVVDRTANMEEGMEEDKGADILVGTWTGMEAANRFHAAPPALSKPEGMALVQVVGLDV